MNMLQQGMTSYRHFYTNDDRFCGAEEQPMRVSINTSHVTCPRCLARHEAKNQKRLANLKWAKQRAAILDCIPLTHLFG